MWHTPGMTNDSPMHTFEITIQRLAGDTWPVVVEESEAGVFLPVRTEGVLDLNVEALDIADPSDYGSVLGRALFREDIREAFAEARARSEDRLHVFLFVEDDKLKELRWERLCWPVGREWRPLALEQRLPFSRYLPSTTDRRFPPIGRADLRMLILAASPSGLTDYRLNSFDEARSVEAVRSALGDRIPSDVLGAVPGAVGPPTLDAMCARVTSERYTLLHVVCHGAFRPQAGETVLYLADPVGKVSAVGTSELIRRLSMLRGARGLPHLTFLSSCESADPSAEGALGGLGQRLVRDLGMPAVVAMTDRVTVETANALAEAFYGRLREHGEVDLALSEAYAGLAVRSDVEVPVPALFSRLGGRPLFSGTLDRELTAVEVADGLDRMEKLFRERAPALLPDLGARTAAVRGLLGADAADLTLGARREREEALSGVNDLSGEVLELSFKALAGGQEPPAYNAGCPFRGLYAFRYEHRGYFFGREPLVEDLAKQLDAHPFLAVLGGSGSGKSSLVLAGLLPRLVGDPPFLPYQVFTPGAKPAESLGTALSALDAPSAGQPSVLVADQFEEVFTLCNDDGQRRAFFDHLLAPAPGRSVILTMRADFWGDCAPYSALKSAMLAHQVLIAPMDAAELRRAMERQAAAVNLRFEAGLANVLLDDVAGEPAAMPLLQHALLELWNRRRGRWLKAGAYEEIGGVKGAIARTADTLYCELNDPEKRRVREIFLRLTRVDEDSNGGMSDRRGTRRRVPMTELVPSGCDSAVTRALVARLADRRLVVVDAEDRVEVGHEALIRHWPRLRGWLDENPALLAQRAEVGDAARDWERLNYDDDLLVHRGERLTQAEALLLGGLIELNATEQRYIEACVARRKAGQAAREAQLRIARSRQLAAMSAAELDRRYDLALLFSVAALRFLEPDDPSFEARQSLVTALNARREVLRFLHVRDSGVTGVAFSPDGKVLAVGSAGGDRRDVALYDVDTLRPLGDPLPTPQVVTGVAFRPDGNVLAVAYDSSLWGHEAEGGGVTVYDIHTGQPLERSLSFRMGVTGVAFSPDGTTLAVTYDFGEGGGGGRGGGVGLYEAAGCRLICTLRDDLGCFAGPAFSPDGQVLAVAYGPTFSGPNGEVLFFDVARREPLIHEPADVVRSERPGTKGRRPRMKDLFRSLVGPWLSAIKPPDRTASVAIKPPDRTASAGLWTSDPLKTPSRVRAVAFRPDGKVMAAGYGFTPGGGLSNVALYDFPALRPLGEPMAVNEGDVSGLVFNPQGTTLAASYGSSLLLGGGAEQPRGGVALCDPAGSRRLDDRLEVVEGPVSRVAFSPDGTTLAVSYGSESDSRFKSGVLLFESVTRRRIGSLLSLEGKAKGIVYDMAFSPDGTTLAAGYHGFGEVAERGVVLFDAAGRPLGDPLPAAGDVMTIAFSPDGTTLAAGYGYHRGGVVLFDVPGRRQLGEPLTAASGVSRIAFRPDGRVLAALSRSNDSSEVALFDIARRHPFGSPLTVGEGSVSCLVFSPDGQALAVGYFGRSSSGVVLFDAAGHPLGDPLMTAWGVTGLAFSPDGTTLAANYGSSDISAVALFDVAAHRSLGAPLTILGGWIYGIAFSPDGAILAAVYGGVGGGGVALYDVFERRPLGGPLRSGNAHVRDLSFRPDGRLLAVAAFQEGVILFDLDPDSWQRTAHRIANRDLTRDEWSRHVGKDVTFRPIGPDLHVR
jgi:WD40 repeat protein/energy-coupling factor transporter ATP-binding protein EcfA2